MNETLVALLGVAALTIAGVVRAIKSDAFNAMLAKFSLPPIPKRALPWVALGLGVAGGFVMGLQEGKGLGVAVAGALGGILPGALAMAGHDLAKGPAEAAKKE